MATNQSKTTRGKDGLKRLDPKTLELLLLKRGWSKTKLAEQASLSRNTAISALQGKGIFAASAILIAEALGVSVTSLLLSDNVTSGGPIYEMPATQEWEPLTYLSDTITASNGLQYRFCRMRHRHIDQRYGRGKFYDLLYVPEEDRPTRQESLTRHVNIVKQIDNHPNVASNLSTGPCSNGWWVIDQWIGNDTLADRLLYDPWPSKELPRLMMEIALGLEALHAVKVVVRELAPSRVLLAESDGRAVLTDFELAKLLDPSPTVSNDWPEDSYRAEEVESGDFDARADLYSWARIFVEAATGKLPARGLDTDTLQQVGLPNGLRQLMEDCLSPIATDRPKSIQVILKELKKWQ